MMWFVMVDFDLKAGFFSLIRSFAAILKAVRPDP
jgi:hypothetical protein